MLQFDSSLINNGIKLRVCCLSSRNSKEAISLQVTFKTIILLNLRVDDNVFG